MSWKSADSAPSEPRRSTIQVRARADGAVPIRRVASSRLAYSDSVSRGEYALDFRLPRVIAVPTRRGASMVSSIVSASSPNNRPIMRVLSPDLLAGPGTKPRSPEPTPPSTPRRLSRYSRSLLRYLSRRMCTSLSRPAIPRRTSVSRHRIQQR